jgi:hypothetical protein
LQSWHALTRLSYPDSFAASSAPVSENLSASGDRKIIELKTLAENTLKKRGYQLRQAATHFDSIYFITQFRPDEEQIAQQGLKELLTCVLDKGNFDEQTLSEWNFDKKVFDPLGYMDFYKSEFAMVAFLTWNGEMDPAKIMFTKGGREIEKSIRAKMTELEKGPYF